MAEPTDAELLAAGGWHPKYARVLARGSVDDRTVIVIIDSAGADGSEPYEYVELMFREDDRWQSSGGSNAGIEGEGWSGGVVYAYGKSTNASVAVELGRERHEVPVQTGGWWLFAARREELEYPKLVQ
jgi:hypothetical protein